MAGQLTIDTLRASSGVLATQNGMTGIAKAWVNWDGTTSTPSTIRGSFNVTSITKNTTGSWTVNFTTAFANTNYSLVSTGGRNPSGTGGERQTSNYLDSYTTSSATMLCTNSVTGAGYDSPSMFVTVFSS
jgi:hypothetical protein